jgi:Na+-translocating ferredoxin:NAD+ oxidoreductase RnfD subunit
MASRPSVIITAIICATFVVLGALAGIVYLAGSGHDSAVVGLFVGGPLLTILFVISNRVRAVKDAVHQQNTADGKA